jgi:hypothetical protein
MSTITRKQLKPKHETKLDIGLAAEERARQALAKNARLIVGGYMNSHQQNGWRRKPVRHIVDGPGGRS